MNEITSYSNILRIRSKFKRLQQLSWNISKLEKAYNLDDISPKDYPPLYETYISLIMELENIYDELKDEQPELLEGSNTN
jgi:hypothetical protein